MNLRVRTTASKVAAPSSKAPASANAKKSPKADLTPELPAPWTSKVAAKKSEAQGLPSFASYFPESKSLPKLPAGQPTVDTFDEPQMRAIHAAYWSAPPSATLGEMIAIATKDPAFKGRKEPVTEKQVGRLMAKLEGSFPWGWRSRALAATSHVLIDALLKAPKGTAVTTIHEGLVAKDKDFPSFAAFKNAARGVWVDEPERFPFVKKALEPSASGYKIEARGDAPDIRKDHLGRFVLNEALANKVKEIGESPEIRHDSTFEDFLGLVTAQIGEGFTKSTFHLLQDRFPKIVPSFHDIRAEGTRRLAELIKETYDGGITSANELIAHLHKEHGYPMWKTPMMTHLREQYPDLIPEFRAAKEEAVYADARRLLDAIKASPEQSYIATGAELGWGKQRVHELVQLIHKRWEEELPTQYKAPSYTLADKKLLQRAVDDAPLNATIVDVMKIVRTEAPQFFETHPLSSPMSFYGALKPLLGFDSFRALQQERFARAFAELVVRSPKGTSLTDLIEHLQDENGGAYSTSAVKRQIAEWRASPKRFPEITKLADKDGVFPWERAKIIPTAALAKRVAEAIEANPGKSLRQIASKLLDDPKFAKEYPNFNKQSVHFLRSKFPKIVPYVDDLAVQGKAARIDARHKELDKLAIKVEKAANAVEDQSGLTVAFLARELGIKPHRVLAAIHRAPAKFPWYNERPSGQLDLYLATRVAHEMENAPYGAELSDILATLKKDKAIRAEYPALNYHTFSALRDRYPELVPHWFNRGQIVRSKLLVDALVTAKKGATFAEVTAELEAKHPKMFAGRWSDPNYVKAVWASNPGLFPFTAELGKTPALVGQGKALAPQTESVGELATRLSKLERITESLPLLEAVGSKLNKEFFADYEMLAIQHLLGPQVALFEQLRGAGMKPTRSTIVGIPYSVSDPVASTLEDKGWDVRVPPLDLERWYQEVRVAMEERIASAKKSGRKILVVDDGGLVAMLFDRYPELAKEAHRFRIVEQTRRGITVADGMKLETPVVNVGQSWGKFVEGPMIGEVLSKKLISRLAGIDFGSLKGKHVGVVGAGTIGVPLAEVLRAAGAIVTMKDVGDTGRSAAKKAGFKLEDDDAKFFGKQDLIIGATGHLSMGPEQLAHLKSGCVIGSASSKLVEIDVDALKKAKKGKIEVIDGESFPPTVRYTMKDGREIKLLASGFPLNFDGDVEDVASEKIQLTMGLLFIGAVQAANVDAAGVRRLDPAKQLDLLASFEKVGGVDVSGAEVADALALAKKRLAEMKAKHGAADRRHGVV